jgi:orotate phosphoribosyltransferase
MMAYPVNLEVELDTDAARRLKEIAFAKGAFLQSRSPIFRLSSGKMSNHYFEGKKITLSSEGSRHVVIGAALMVAAVAVVADEQGRKLSAFIVREEAKAHGTQRKIEGHLNEGSRVVIVDDVITTGGSVLKAIRAVEDLGCEVVKVIALVDRHEGGSDELRSQGYVFQPFLGLLPSGEVIIEESIGVTT